MAAGQQQPGAGGQSLAPPVSLLQQHQQQQQQQQMQQNTPPPGNPNHHLAAQMQMAAAAAAARNGSLQMPNSTARMGMPQMQNVLRPNQQQMQMAHFQHQMALAAAAAARSGAASAGAPPPTTLKMAEAAPAAKRLKKRKLDRSIPDRIASLLPESSLYSQLVEFESRVDAALARKKLEIQEAVQNPPRYQRTLRMYVFNTYANQVNTHDPHMGFNPGEPPSWTLRIMGRVLGDDGQTDSQASRSWPYSKFSSFFKRITVQLDPGLYPENSTIVWDASKNNSHVEGFEIKRKGDKELTAGIRLELKHTPDRYKLSPALAELLGVEVETRARIIAAMWHYIKGKKLQDPNDPTIVHCDLPLHRILGEERIKFTSISHKLQQHLSAPPPIHLEHRIKLSGRNPAANACYDIMVDVITPLQKEMAAFLANMERHRDVEAYDEVITAAIRNINQHRKRRAFFLGFSQSPVEFINGLVASQSRDLKIVNGQASRNADKERRSQFYCQPWVEDAVIRYLNRRTAKMPDSANPGAPAASGPVNNSNAS